MSKDAKKPVKAKRRVSRAAGPAATGGAGGVGQDADKKRDGGPVAKGAMAAQPAVEMPAARAPRVTKPGDAEEVEADKAAARVAQDKQTGAIEEAAPTAARKVDSETPPEVEQVPVARAGKAGDEKKPEGKTPAKDDKKPVAKAGDKKPDSKTPAKDDKKPVARAAAGEQTPSAAPAPVTKAIESPGQGRPLEPSTRAAIERRMPVDLRGVRIHDDAAARNAASAIDARAFTHGKDIWLGRGESDRDVGLMAHEAAHVAQQSDGRGSRVAPKKGAGAKQKDDKPKEEPIDKWPSDDKPVPKAPGSISPKERKLEVAVLELPRFKYDITTQPVQMKRRDRTGKHIQVWEDSFKSGGPKLESVLPNVKPLPMEGVPEGTYFLRPKQSKTTFVIGDKKTVEMRAIRPSWTKAGKPHLFDVDHRQEHQLGGDDENNLWLLDASANRSVGSVINNEINEKIAKVVKAAPDNLRDKPTAAEVRDSYTSITAATLKSGGSVTGTPSINYDKGEIADGQSLKALQSLTLKEAEGLRGKPSRISLFDRKEGGKQRFVSVKDGQGKWPGGKIRDTVHVEGVSYDADSNTGALKVKLFKDIEGIEEITVGDLPIEPLPVVQYGGWVSPWGIRDRLQNGLKIKPLSAVQIADVSLDFDEGVIASGSLTPSIPLLSNVGIELKIDGDGVRLAKVFSGSELALPGPVKVLGSSLEVSFGTAGFALRGNVPFEIEGLGKGSIDAKGKAAKRNPTFELEGTLEVEKELFDEARITVRYKDHAFSGDGVLKIGAKKITGIKSATITASIAEDLIKAEGQVEVDIPGVKGGAVALEYGKETGLMVSGTLAIDESIPGIKGGSIALKLRKQGEGDFVVSGAITATAGIPGVTATITGAYEDGAFEIGGTVDYAKGMLSGQVTVGATNRPVGEDGVPAGEPGETVIAYGRGQVTIKIAPWLQGTVGVQIKPDGQLVVSGEVALPSALELFEKKELKKRIFSIGLDIPIVGFSVLGQRVGIFATIGGGLDAEAAIGPGELREAKLGVTYNPDDEAATKVTGGAQLYIPASAGLRLFVKGAVGAGIPIVSASVGLEVGAALGLEAALESSLQVDWTPSKGLELSAELAAHVEPKFTFDLTAFAEVTVDYLFGTSTLYDERWQLAAFEYGSNLRFGIKFPFHYLEGQPFDVKLSDVEFEYPQIDAGDILKGLVKSIV